MCLINTCHCKKIRARSVNVILFHGIYIIDSQVSFNLPMLHNIVCKHSQLEEIHINR